VEEDLDRAWGVGDRGSATPSL